VGGDRFIINWQVVGKGVWVIPIGIPKRTPSHVRQIKKLSLSAYTKGAGQGKNRIYNKGSQQEIRENTIKGQKERRKKQIGL